MQKPSSVSFFVVLFKKASKDWWRNGKHNSFPRQFEYILTRHAVTSRYCFPHFQKWKSSELVIWILLINSTVWRHIDVILGNHVNQIITIYWHDQYIILCNFGVRTMSGFGVIDEAPLPLPVAACKKQTNKQTNKKTFWIGLSVTN